MKVLFVGEIVAGPGRKTVKQVLPEILKEYDVDFVISNVENSAHGKGVTPEIIQELQNTGINYFTGGDHIFWQRGTDEYIDDLPLVRPANYPPGTPGKGYDIVDTGANGNILVANLMGRTGFSSISAYFDDPFRTIDSILEETSNQDIKIKIVDMHAESTSEKLAMGFYLDGKVDIVVGSHSHIPTADGFVMPKGTLYISDIGMTGIIDSVLGVKTDIIIKMFRTAQMQRFVWEESGRRAFRSVLFDTSEKTLKRLDKML